MYWLRFCLQNTKRYVLRKNIITNKRISTININPKINDFYSTISNNNDIKKTLRYLQCISSCTYSTTTAITSSFEDQHNNDKVLKIGIYHETYGIWERRAPITPLQIHFMLEKQKQNDIVSTLSSELLYEFYVQPSNQRIFSNEEYEINGAIITNDLSMCDIILGIKRPKNIIDLISNKTYLFFGHVTKGQSDNMLLLHEILKRNIQFIDYEHIINDNNNGRRLVSFGKFAGIAGTLHIFHMLGIQLMKRHGISTSFVSFPSSSTMFSSINDAKERLLQIGEAMKKQQNGIGTIQEPIVVAVTGGPNGNVFHGILEILTLLPHEFISVQDLPKLYNNALQQRQNNKIYICLANSEFIYQKIDNNINNEHHYDDKVGFDREHFRNYPNLYRCTFSKNVLPYTTIFINAMYYDARFPKIITKHHMKCCCNTNRLLLIADISCDINGGIEFVERTTTIEKPYFLYDPIKQCEVLDDNNIESESNTIPILAVDILPSEVPKESSEHFGNAVQIVLDELKSTKSKQLCDKTNISKNFDPLLLPQGLANAVITNNGKLSHQYRYLETLMNRTISISNASVSSSASSLKKETMILSIHGHIFDSGLINHILDVIEHYGHGVAFERCTFPPQSSRKTTKTSVVLRIDGNDVESLQIIESKVRSLIELSPKADATCERLDYKEQEDIMIRSTKVTVEDMKKQTNVLLLGSGRVSKSFVEFLGRTNEGCIITIVSDKEDDAKDVATATLNGRAVGLDVSNDVHRLSELVEESDLIVSLLPAPMHVPIALECILHQKNLITASYESDEMRSIGERAKNAGIIILNEVGLDPGLDHMSAMRIIHNIQQRGGKITSFSSVCGGLPAPEAANNPLKYKFSWSPRGVFRACQNAATYKMHGKVLEVPGMDLLLSAIPFEEGFSDLDLECLPNRNSLHYEKLYGIDGAHTVFRGTLRYSGFSRLMHTFQQIGLLREDETINETCQDLMYRLKNDKGNSLTTINDFILDCVSGDAVEAERTMDCLQWIGMMDQTPILSTDSVVNNFCKILEDKLSYGVDERDMVIMHHRIKATFEDGCGEYHRSVLKVFGDPKHSAMSKTVGYTTAAAADFILSNNLKDIVGLVTPTVPELYEPILESVAGEGIVFEESIS